MHDLLKLALVGTRNVATELAPRGPASELALEAAPTDPEHRLLIQAGAEAVHRAAGFAPASGLVAIDPAPSDGGGYCPPKSAAVLRTMLRGDMTELLPELLERLDTARLLVPPDLLPLALDVDTPERRTTLLAVIGARGRWLSRLNPRWAWVDELFAEQSDGGSALKRAWEEGDSNARFAALARVRRGDPAEGRRWIEEAWPSEKAENRVRLLEALREGLSPEDEPLLESALDDRSTAVRTAAAGILALLPRSAFAARMRARADAMVTVGREGWLRKRPRFECAPPSELDKESARDIIAKPPPGVGQRAWWALQIASAVPLSHWAKRFESTPDALIGAAQACDYGDAIVLAWTQAAVREPEASLDWLAALAHLWEDRYIAGSGPGEPPAGEHVLRLLGAMPRAQAEKRLLERVAAAVRKDSPAFAGFAEALPGPWGADFARVYLRIVREGLASTLQQNSFTWARQLPAAGRALPYAAFDAALDPWNISDNAPWQGICLREVGRMMDIVRARKTYFEEIRL